MKKAAITSLCLAATNAVVAVGEMNATTYKQIVFSGANPDHDHPTCSGKKTQVNPVQYCKYSEDHSVYKVGTLHISLGVVDYSLVT
jgi:hypothetical protein